MASYLKPFNFNLNDIQFLLDQVNFLPLFRKKADGSLEVIINWDGSTAASSTAYEVGVFDKYGNLLWNGDNTYVDAAAAMAALGTSYSSVLDIRGIRNVNGTFNNLYAGREGWGAADQGFPRLAHSDFTHYTSLDISTHIAGAPTSGLITPTDPAHPFNLTDADAAHSALASSTINTRLVHNIVDTPDTETVTTVFGDITLSTVIRAEIDNQTSVRHFDGKHLFANWTDTTLTSTVTSLQEIYTGPNGVQTILHDLTTQAPPPTITTATTISGGELDAAYHGQLQAFSASAPWDYVGGLYRTDGFNGIGAVDVTDARNFDYTITFDTPTSTNPNMHSVVDYTPRMIANLVASGGVVTLKDANNHIVYWNPDKYNSGTSHDANYAALIDNWNTAHPDKQIDTAKLVTGAAIVTDWGLVGANGGPDMQNPDNGEIYVGAANPGIAALNGIATLFGQFFDHGLDFIGKGSPYKVVIPLAVDDPLYGVIGPDGNPTTSITITRATVSGQDANGSPNYVNHDSPYIDQNQTYGAQDDITNLLREWYTNPVTHQLTPGARLVDGTTLSKGWTDAFGNTSTDTLPTLNELRAYVLFGTTSPTAAQLQSIQDGTAVGTTGRDAITWEDVSVAVRHRDATGHVMAGDSGQPLLLDMNPAFNTVTVTNAGLAHVTQTALDALNAVNGALPDLAFDLNGNLVGGVGALAPYVNMADFSIKASLTTEQKTAVGEILMESVGDHYIAGDGRTNENVGLTAIHHVFHEEHSFQVQNLEQAIILQAAKQGDAAVAHSWQIANTDVAAAGTYLARDANGDYFASSDTGNPSINFALDIDGNRISAAGSYTDAAGYISWDQDKIFQGAKLTVEMEYQHAAVDQYARAITPNLQEFAGTAAGVNAAVTLEYAQAAFRFGHSQLRETIDTMDPNGGVTGKVMAFALEASFLNPGQFANLTPGDIVMGMARQQANEIDEFVTPALQQGLLGLPLDLATINIARGRDVGLPTLNAFRVAAGIGPAYANWLDFQHGMGHPENLAAFIAAYSLDGDLAQAKSIVEAYASGVTSTYYDAAGVSHDVTAADAWTFLSTDKGVDKLDLWLGGLAEMHVSGGVLGETFDAIFVDQIHKLMDNDRFYYLQRLAGQQFGDEIINEQFKDIFERTTDTQHLNGSIFGYADAYYDFGRKPVAADGVNPIALSDPGYTEAMQAQHKYGDIIDDPVNADANGAGIGLGIWSDDAPTLAQNGDIVTRTAPPPPGAGNAGPMSPTGEPPAPASPTLKYIFDGRPDVTGGSTNADGTLQSGAASSEVIVGTKWADVIFAGPADDTVYGEDGNDIIYGGQPGPGASAGLDHLYGGAGDDIIYGQDMPDLIDGGAGDDWLFGDSSGASINGTDQVIGSEGNDHIYGGVGIDKLYGGYGDDYIYGGADTDPFTFGGDGNDYINGDNGQDQLYGGNGDDIVDGGTGIDKVQGDEGDDILRIGSGDSAFIENGGVAGGDNLIGDDAATNSGFDLADYSQEGSNTGAAIDLTQQFAGALPADLTPTPIQVAAVITTANILTQIEGVIGSKNGDILQGDSLGDATADVSLGDNWLIGGSGTDLLEGRGGNDVIVGGSIRLDTLIGTYAVTADDYAKMSTAQQALWHETSSGSGIFVSNAGGGAYWNDTTHTIDGASHRTPGSLQNNGLLDDASGLGLGVAYAKHFTDLLKSGDYRNFVFGDGGTDAVDNFAKFTGNAEDYTITAHTFTSANAGNVVYYTVTDNGHVNGGLNDPHPTRAASDGTDIVIGVSQLEFADQSMSLQIDNNAPVFDAFAGAWTVDENQPFALAATATDPEINPITYSIVTGAGFGTDGSLFSINPTTGDLSLTPRDRESPTDANADSVYEVTVKATDSLGAFSTKTITVTVNDVNEYVVSSSRDWDAADNTIAENATGLVGITAHAIDSDATTNTVTYSLVDSGGGTYTGPFAIDANTGVVSLNTALDYEIDGPTQTIYVEATSADGSTSITSFDVALTNVNEAGGGSISLAQTLAQAGSTSFTATNGVSDPDVVSPNSVVTQWQVLNGSTWTDISGATGEVYDAASQVGKLIRAAAVVPEPSPFTPYTVGSTTTAMVGDGSANVLSSASIVGLAGGSILVGLGGNDTYRVNSVLDTIVEAVGGGADMVGSSAINIDLNNYANVEKAYVAGAGLSITGTAGSNTLYGDTHASANGLFGGLGDDVYVVGAGDWVQDAGGIWDVLITRSAFDLDLTATLPGGGLRYSGIEILRANNGSAAALMGDGSVNVLDGQSSTGSNHLYGRAGNDIYDVGAGDVVHETAADGGSGRDTVRSSTISLNLTGYLDVEAATLTGNAAHNLTAALDRAATLTGNGASNILLGGNLNDILIGGGGADQLIGGAGRDQFRFVAASDSTASATDVILDFQDFGGNATTGYFGDLVDLRQIDALAGVGDNAFTYHALGDASAVALGDLRQHLDGTTMVLDLYISSTSVADMTIRVNNHSGNMVLGDFLL